MMAGLASRLANRDHQVTLITLDQGQQDLYAVDPDVARRPLAVMGQSHGIVKRYFGARRRIIALRGAIDQIRPDVILSFCDRTNILTLMAAGRGAAPVVVSERSDPAEQSLGRIWETLRWRNYPRAAALVALTDSAATYLRQRIDRPVIVIPSAVDRPPLTSDRSAAQANRRILALGRLEYEKGFDRLLDAFSDLLIRAPAATEGWTLRIIGEGSLRQQLNARIQQLDLADRVSMPGRIMPVWEELAQATLFVLPSRYEGFPSALLEAMATGVPSVAADCPSGPRVIVNHQVNGLLVANNQSSLASGMWRLIECSETRERLGQAGKQVIDQFDWESMVDAYQRVLQQALMERNQGAARN